MRAQCIRAVEQAINRPITQAEAQGIEARIKKSARVIAAQDPSAFAAMTPAQQLQAAAQLAARDLVEEATLKKVRIGLTIQAYDRIEAYINDQVAKGMDRLDAVRRTLVDAKDGKSNFMSMETRIEAHKMNFMRQLVDVVEVIDPRLFGLMEDPEGVRLLTKAIFDEPTGNAEIDRAGKAVREVFEQARQKVNANGGKIGRLENFGVPQHHSQMKVLGDTRNWQASRDQWVAFLMPLLNRRKYTREDGTLMNDAEVTDFMRNAWTTIATGGANKIEPGKAQGTGMLANANAEHRSIHFKDADSYLTYQAQYGENSLWDILGGHFSQMSKMIAGLETYGPNADRMFDMWVNKALQAEAVANPPTAEKNSITAKKLMRLYDTLSGKNQQVVNARIAQGFDSLRSLLVANRLGSAVVSSIADEATLHLTASINRLPHVDVVRNIVSQMNPLDDADRNLAHRAGLALDSMMGEMNRWGQDALGPTFTSKLASTTLRASGLTAVDNARRAGFGVTMMSAIGEIAGKYARLADIDPNDYRFMLSKGITDTDFAVWKKAQLEQWGAGNGVLTPESIMAIPDADLAAITNNPRAAKEDAVLRLLGVVAEETNMAVIKPSAETRDFISGRFDRGTWSGELMRSVFLFKSFPIELVTSHWKRGLGMETAGGRAMYIAKLVAGTTVLGAVAQIVSDFLSGKDPKEYFGGDPKMMAKSWMQALLKGGSLGIYGDFLFSRSTQTGNVGPVASLLGPFAGLVEETYNLTVGNAIDASQGKDTHFEAELANFLKRNTPIVGSLSSLWYTKAALDHFVFQEFQEYLSPGYLQRMKDRAQREFGQTYWWEPGTGLEGMRAPNLERIAGE